MKDKYKQENREGRLAVVDTATGRLVGTFTQKHFADDHIARLLRAAEGPEPAKRARDAKGRMKADDPSTPDVNEAYVGGKAPKKKAKAKKKAPAKKKAAKKK